MMEHKHFIHSNDFIEFFPRILSHWAKRLWRTNQYTWSDMNYYSTTLNYIVMIIFMQTICIYPFGSDSQQSIILIYINIQYIFIFIYCDCWQHKYSRLCGRWIFVNNKKKTCICHVFVVDVRQFTYQINNSQARAVVCFVFFFFNVMENIFDARPKMCSHEFYMKFN